MSNELTQVTNANLNSFLDKAREEFIQAWPVDGGAAFQKEKSFAMQSFANNSQLMEIVNRTKEGQVSCKHAIVNIANIGLSLNPALAHAYLVPRKNKVCLDISYRGLLAIAFRSGAIVMSNQNVVKEGETFILNGMDECPTHQYDPFDEKRHTKKTRGAYCSAKLPNGDWQTVTIDAADLLKIKNTSPSSKSSTSPWSNWSEQMEIKSVIKRASKFWLKGKDNLLQEAVRIANDTDGIVVDMDGNIIQEAHKEINQSPADELKAELLAD